MNKKSKTVLIIENEWNDFDRIVKKANKAGLSILPYNQEMHNTLIEKLQSDKPYEYIEEIIQKNFLNLRCIICDLKLFDGIEGSDIIQHIRKNIKIKNCPRFAEFIPIIIWTNYSTLQITKTALKSGGDFYIAKPRIKAKSDNYFWDIVESQCERFDKLCNDFIISKRCLRPNSDKPKIFIGSSKEALGIANAVQSNLSNFAFCKVWDKDVFEPGDSTIETLERIIDDFDYSIFIFHDDDKIFIRKDKNSKEENIPRDNVIFEYGMFLSKHTRKKTFFIVPKDDNKVKVHILTDILGVYQPRYDVQEAQTSGAKTALNEACNEIINKISKIEED